MTKRRELPYNNFKYNIKWGNGEDDVIDSYVRCLMLIMRNKVLLNDGDLQKNKDNVVLSHKHGT